jgi:hypothetical protein
MRLSITMTQLIRCIYMTYHLYARFEKASNSHLNGVNPPSPHRIHARAQSLSAQHEQEHLKVAKNIRSNN